MTMFAAELTTPHPEIAQAGVEREKLLESTRFLTIAAAYNVSEGTYDDQVEAAYATANLVRQTLRFDAKNYYGRKDLITPYDITKKQLTNCHGYSIVTSECLDEIGIPHYVAFANQHSFILLQTPDGGHTNIIDTAVKELYVGIDGDIDEPIIAEQINDGTSAANVLNMDSVLSKSNFKDGAHAPEIYPWMDFGATRQTSRRYSNNEPQDRLLMLRSYKPQLGRNILQAYANFSIAIRRRDYETAHGNLQMLDGEYPDIDRRNNFKEPTLLVRELARIGDMTLALKDIEVIEHSTWTTDDLVVHLWPPDQRRHLGVIASRRDLIARSISEYDMIEEQRLQADMPIDLIQGRISKAKRQWAMVE